MFQNRTLGANTEYIEQAKSYTKVDAILAIFLYLFMVVLFVLMGKYFIVKTIIEETELFFFTGLLSVLCIGFVFMVIYLRKQPLATIGFSKTRAKESLILGIILLLIIVFGKVIGSLSYDVTLQSNLALILMRIVYYLIFISFTEELVFRGFIGTRLFGFFQHKLFSIVVVGILFSVLHIPFQMIITQINFSQYLSSNILHLVAIFFYHLIFQWIYSKYNSIIAPVMLHFIIDFIGWFVI